MYRSRVRRIPRRVLLDQHDFLQKARGVQTPSGSLTSRKRPAGQICPDEQPFENCIVSGTRTRVSIAPGDKSGASRVIGTDRLPTAAWGAAG